MAENILPKTPLVAKLAVAKKPKISIVGILLAFVLFITLVLLGERIIFDLNRLTNPAVEVAVDKNKYKMNSDYPSYRYEYQQSALSSKKIYYKKDNTSQYFTYKILIHSAFIIPIFLLVFLFYYLYLVKEVQENLKVAIYAYFGFALWMLLHLLGELCSYIIQQFENVAIYIILVLLVLIITPLTIFIQKKMNKKAANS